MWQWEKIQALLWKQLDVDQLICAGEFRPGDAMRIETHR
jgi:hypothetical protein